MRMLKALLTAVTLALLSGPLSAHVNLIWDWRCIYSLRGNPVGQMSGTHVHKLSGEYVGELLDDMVVDKYVGNLGNIGFSRDPGNAGRAANPRNRGPRSYGYPDVFHTLPSTE